MSVPIEPVPDFTVSPTVHIAATAVAAAVCLITVAVAGRQALSSRTPIPVLFMLGGALTVGFEPIVDVLGKCYLPRDFQWTMFTVLDRPMPVYAVLVYTAFFGGFALMSWSHLHKGGRPEGLWRKYLIAAGINIFLFETPAVSIFKVYTYYGDQPFNFWGFPLWWAFLNPVGPIAAGVIVHVLYTRLQTPPRILLPLSVALVPVTDGMSNGASGFPTWIALNSEVPTWLTWCAGALTIGLSVLTIRGLIYAVTRLEQPTATSLDSRPTQIA